MALERKPPHLGDIGDEEYVGCNDPTHHHDCNCGATPDLDYERAKDI